MTSDNAERGGQTEARSLAHFLGRKERFKNLVLNLPGHAGAGVRHSHNHIGARLGFRIRAGINLIEHDVLRGHGQSPSAGHGIAGIQTKVHEDLIQLSGIAGNQPGMAAGGKTEIDVLRKGVVDHLFNITQKMNGIERDVLPFDATGEGEHLLDQIRPMQGTDLEGRQ